ncbi:hypothetical protein [Rhodohalobacter sp.]|uniref:hypothetical protein n=1 Tax=Rhodohalobacter sp. TaxID=1974210 RepID=UPI002ACE25C0|nr:hypothetical protein [Rhodohalobacter sp.]MDZ7756288.1 hypothetical protein [Rhodohalobacter sp.]
MLPETGQQGITYQVYEEDAQTAYDTAVEIFDNSQLPINLDQGWSIENQDEDNFTLETDWRETGSSSSVSGGAIMGEESDERYKLSVEVDEAESGSKVMLKSWLSRIEMTGNPERESTWRNFDVNRQTAVGTYLIPVFEELEEQGLTVQN